MLKTFSLRKGLGSWIENSKETSFEEADIVLLPGGSDVDPALYGHKKIHGTYIDRKSDDKEMALLNKAIENNKFIIGICKGSQLLTVKAGGFLIQDVTNHHRYHEIKTFDGKEFLVNSSHHQMSYPFEIRNSSYSILGWSRKVSSHYLISMEHNLVRLPHGQEPEVIYYNKIKGLAIQSHPEWASSPKRFNHWLNQLIPTLIKH